MIRLFKPHFLANLLFSRRHHLYHSQRSTRTIDGSNCVPSLQQQQQQGPVVVSNGGSSHNKSYTISGHSRQRSQPETYNSQHHPQHQHQSPVNQPIYAQHHPQRTGRPASSYYEFEVVQQQQHLQNGSGSKSQHSSPRKMSAPSPPSRPQWNNNNGGVTMGGGSMRGPRVVGHNSPYATQVQVQQQKQAQMPSASKV